MPKRHVKVKRSKAELLENDLNRWLAKKDAAIELLIKATNKLRELRRADARLAKRERRLKAIARQARVMKMGDVTDIPVGELPIADVLPRRKRKAEAAVQGSA